MKNYEIIYSKESLLDLKSIGEYIAAKSSSDTIAKNFISKIRDSISKLDFFPAKHPQITYNINNNMHTFHVLSVLKHVIFYLIDEEKAIIRIVRILNCRQDIPKEFRPTTLIFCEPKKEEA